jgi:hypothetical protein
MVAHIPNFASSRYLVQLNHAPVNYVLFHLLPASTWKRVWASIGFRLPGSSISLGTILSSVGVVARHPKGRPLLRWLSRLPPGSNAADTVLVSVTRDNQRATAVIYRFDAANLSKPCGVAKVLLASTTKRKLVSEVDHIRALAPAARAAGARVSTPLRICQIGGRPVLLESAVGGRSVAALLLLKPDRLQFVLDRLIDWLEQWNRHTMGIRPLDRNWLDREIVYPAKALAPLLTRGTAYREWLVARCAEAVGLSVPFVATHNDLTMSNISIDDRGSLGIVDWESASESGLPLVDLFYASVDAVAATTSYRNRRVAFEACFATGARFGKLVMRLRNRVSAALAIQPSFANLCFHACWLHHALNEHQNAGSAEHRPFLEILQSVASREIIEWRQRP